MTAAWTLLEDTSLPRYFRMRLLLLLYSISERWEDAEEVRAEAEALWRILRARHKSVYIDRTFAEVRVVLGEAKESLAKK
jgi:hypothetical protein